MHHLFRGSLGRLDLLLTQLLTSFADIAASHRRLVRTSLIQSFLSL
jgi:hypothetical protein